MSRQMAQQAHASTSSFSPVPNGILQRKCAACGTHTPGGGSCQRCGGKKRTQQRREATESEVQDAPTTLTNENENGVEFDVSDIPNFSGGGRPLEPSIAARYRPGLGSLTEKVRVHDDGAANAMVAGEGAVAFTTGANIYFAANSYQPHTPAGRNLLTHELAHVWQQHSADGPPSGYQSRPNDRYEQEADRMADSEAFTTPRSFRAPDGRIKQRRAAAEQIASEIRTAIDGLGTDEDAIFNALAGRNSVEIAAIEAAYVALSGGETLEASLRDELSGDDLAQALSLLRGESAATEAARQIWNAVRGLGTDEESIYAAVAGRTSEQWQAIQDAYRQMANEALIGRLQDELSSSEWTHLQSLLPGAEGGAAADDDRATVAANQIQLAVDGLGTDEEAIFSALTGRSQVELQEIQRRYRLLTGEIMVTRLRDELSDSDYERVQLMLNPEAAPTRFARALRDAMERPGTDESAIMALLTGRPVAELPQIRAEYQRLYGETLTDRLRGELSGNDLARALQLLGTGLLEPADEIHLAVAGLGTDEERLFAVLTEISATPAKIAATIASYAVKGYGDMLGDIRDDLSGAELDRAMELLHGSTPTTSCSTEERNQGLEAISVAISWAQYAVARLDVNIGAGTLSSRVSSALTANFNPGGMANGVTIALARQVRGVLNAAQGELLAPGSVTCVSQTATPGDNCFTRGWNAWTITSPAQLVRLCPTFFPLDDDDKSTAMLHEFVHHSRIQDQHYRGDPAYSTLVPSGNGSTTDSLNNSDSYAYFARALY